MLSWEERRQLVKIANLYYNDSWTQEQIARKFSVSRPVISKSLQKAKEVGIIEIFIKDESVHTVNLEKSLEKRFNLTDVVVVPISSLTPDMVTKSVAQAGAYYLSKNMKNVKTIAVSWGTTLAALVKEYPYELREAVKVVPLEGGMGRKRVEIHANQIAYELAKKMGGTCSYLYAPAIVETQELRERLMVMQDINEVLEEGRNADIAITGIGNPYKASTLEKIGYLQRDEIDRLKSMGVAGDMGFRFFDQNGHTVDNLLDKKTIGISLEELRNIKTVIAVVAGSHKTESILAALKGKYINVLITDEQTAMNLLKEE
ncbi:MULTISPECIES: sugar-binding transcriptional regulator [Mesobacillus]|uniref:Transcriptional regulator n=2 Tax=Mesobacillus TaxID=2675231 RepID=A0A0D6Z4D1_9BACI|nr:MULTISPECIES: sugar-binding transcriptional regulator [Mesobacillus]KIY20569.1 transcriptional regulator [Mesobacillus subterraneus]MDQ0415606.1 DNA-binding transcriptional regulator LsrR (DeoR family) [Mesobacillus stamsii]